MIGALDRVDVLSRKIFAGKLPGERRSKARGQSVEFDDYRNYVAGDDLRHIDWNVFARLDRLFIKLFREEQDLALHLIVDASGSMHAGRPSKLVFAQRVAMALGYVGLVHQNRVSAWAMGLEGEPRLPALRGRTAIQRLAAFLTDDVGGGKPVGTPAPEQFVADMKRIGHGLRGKGVVVLISDMLLPEGIEQGLTYLAGSKGFDTFCLQVLSPGELEPESESEAGLVGDLSLIDAESGARTEVTVSASTIAAYKKRLDALCERVAGACASRSMSHVLVRSDADVTELVFQTLRRRGMIG